jgi:BA14K-like protein
MGRDLTVGERQDRVAALAGDLEQRLRRSVFAPYWVTVKEANLGYADNAYYDGGYDSGPSYIVSSGQSADPAYCAQRYRSYDPASGTYLGYDGLRHPCE